MNILHPPKWGDSITLSAFVILITWQPYLFHHEIIMMETGIHLPAINALFHGEIPYRDFIYLRGPLELFVPTIMMLLFGKNMVVLPIFYYGFTILTLMMGVLLAQQIFKTRFIFYLFVPIFVARTFPRVSFYYWGGFRYFLGFLTLFCAIRCFQKKQSFWMSTAGFLTAACLLTTVEAGLATGLAIVSGVVWLYMFKSMERSFILDAFKKFIIGFFLLLLPYLLFMWSTGSLIPYLEATYVIPTGMLTTLQDARGQYPDGFAQMLAAFLPHSWFFKFITPVFCYFSLAIYLCYRIRSKRNDWKIFPLITLAVYSIILYIAAFRKIEGHHFEMALQPEKILYFFLIEEGFLYLWNVRLRLKYNLSQQASMIPVQAKMWVIHFLIFALIVSSLGFSVRRYHKRFKGVQWIEQKIRGEDKDLSLLSGQNKRALNIQRAKGMVVPTWQADEIESIVQFIQSRTEPNEPVFTYLELGNFNFWFDRPFVGRFPIASFSWVDERWHRELIEDFKANKPEYVIMTHLRHRTFPAAIYFRYPKNVKRYKEMRKLIDQEYKMAKSFTSVAIYQRR